MRCPRVRPVGWAEPSEAHAATRPISSMGFALLSRSYEIRRRLFLPVALFVDAGGALAMRQLGGDIRRGDAAGGPQPEQMVEQIGVFADQRGIVVPHHLHY